MFACLFVTQILFEGKRAVGVLYVHNGTETVTVRANKEVLVTAGTIGSAKLLMLSGVGPGDHLGELKVDIRLTYLRL